MFLSARWVLPVHRPPVADGWIEVVDHRVVRVGDGPAPGPVRELGDVAVLPGMVNAHTHLELSWMEGRVAPAESFVAWLRTLLQVRHAAPADGPMRLAATRHAIAASRETGTVLVGDISNTLETIGPLREAGLSAAVFHEMVGFNPADPTAIVGDAWARIDDALATSTVAPHEAADADVLADVRACVVAHAPYSVFPSLFPEVVRRHRGGPLSIHLGESVEEVEFLRTGRGAFRDLFEEIGVWTDAWRAPARTPVDYIAHAGYLQPGMLAVHGVQFDDTQLERLLAAQAVIVTCPRSNVWVGAGLPRISNFYASGVPVAIGTDSLASVSTLSMFDELAELRRVAPDVTAASLIASATRVGAEALGFGDTFGTIAPGRRAAFVTVAIPAGVGDVEEYLVGGVPQSAVRPLWL